MRASMVGAIVVVVAALLSGVAPTRAAAQSDMDEGAENGSGQDHPDDQGFDAGHDDRVPDDVRRHDFQPNQQRQPTTLDDGFRHDGRRFDPLPPSQQPPPMRPYWGTMRPYWKPLDPSVTKHQGGARHHQHRVR